MVECGSRPILLSFKRIIVTAIAAVSTPEPAVCTLGPRVARVNSDCYGGEELIKVYGKGEGAVKAFCVECGSSLFGGEWPDGPQISIPTGAFDDDPELSNPQFHTFVRMPRSLGYDYRQPPAISRAANLD